MTNEQEGLAIDQPEVAVIEYAAATELAVGAGSRSTAAQLAEDGSDLSFAGGPLPVKRSMRDRLWADHLTLRTPRSRTNSA
jgi:hypothetical protein